MTIPIGQEFASPRYNHNDCLIVSMLLLKRSAISPSRAATPAPEHNPMCRNMVGSIDNPDAPQTPYHRYVHGYWTLAGLLLAILPFGAATMLLYGVAVALCVALMASRNPPFVALGAGALCFTGLHSFGWSLSFAPADISILAALLYWSRRPLSEGSGAVLGALVAAFEFLTGALPVATALILAVGAFQRRSPIRPLLAFGMAFLLMFALKAAIVALGAGPAEVAAAGGKLSDWVATGNWALDPASAAKIGISAETVQQSRLLSFAFEVELTLYTDPTVKWGGMEVGGIRISHLSHIERGEQLALTATKGSRKPHRVMPLVMEQHQAAPTPPAEDTRAEYETWANDFLNRVNRADSVEKVRALFARAEETIGWLKANHPDLADAIDTKRPQEEGAE
ncbi:hypothetical protein [Sphingomonas sp. LHG3406-1]|uniref:hypothetical protein n=1 Tax=Sphingomonas sp. LHG3406-1 TaxID=2804617 RepID=UPI0026271845|nr:hypothetical protein [Sphingomonas sp. LHG3406-1]